MNDFSNEFTVNVILKPRIKNPLSKALSRFRFQRFRRLAREADPHPTRASISSNLRELSSEMSFYQSMSVVHILSPNLPAWATKYEEFCKRYNLDLYLTTEHKLRLFATYMARSLTYRAIKVCLAALRFTELERGCPDNFGNMQALQYYFGASRG